MTKSAIKPTTKPDGLTPSATVGPYFKYGLTPAGAYPWNDAFAASTVTADAVGDRIKIRGRVVDGEATPIRDCMLEIWQADGSGRFAHPLQSGGNNTSFRGFARADTDTSGNFAFETLKPGRVPGPGGKQQAPHILVAVFARGMLKHLYTRIYFADEATANAEDAVLAVVPAGRRNTLIATKGDDGAYRFDIRLQGGDETVFFDL